MTIRTKSLLATCYVIAVTLVAQVGMCVRTNNEFTVTMEDGSSLVCKPLIDAIPLKTSFAEMKIPFARLENIKINKKEGTVALVLLNGDNIQGKCDLTELPVSSLLGDLKLALAIIERIDTTFEKEPVYDDSPERRNQCINNLRQIDSAKEQWALANRKGQDSPIDIPRINQYIKGNRTPVCPAGGKYTYNTLRNRPECSVPGHKW